MPRAVALGGARMLGWVPRYCSSQEVNSAEPVTVTTQFLTDDGTDSGTINKVKQFYTQNGKTVEHPMYTINGKPHKAISDEMCADWVAETEDGINFLAMGGMGSVDTVFKNGAVLVMSLRDDRYANMLWLDSIYSVDVTDCAASPGACRGSCPITSGVPADVEKNVANATIHFSDIKYGRIGTTIQTSEEDVSVRDLVGTTRVNFTVVMINAALLAAAAGGCALHMACCNRPSQDDSRPLWFCEVCDAPTENRPCPVCKIPICDCCRLRGTLCMCGENCELSELIEPPLLPPVPALMTVPKPAANQRDGLEEIPQEASVRWCSCCALVEAIVRCDDCRRILCLSCAELCSNCWTTTCPYCQCGCDSGSEDNRAGQVAVRPRPMPRPRSPDCDRCLSPTRNGKFCSRKCGRYLCPICHRLHLSYERCSDDDQNFSRGSR